MSGEVGPWWFPKPLRQALTWLSGLFFDTASWEKHDEGYARGHPSRAECDRLFLAAMLLDASQAGPVWRMLVCSLLGWAFWVSARVGGWLSYGKAERNGAPE